MNDMIKVTEPKSDQWNYDDFISGPITFKITDVRVKGGQEQPVEISLEGTPKFYRPCKSMCRVLVSAWGPDSSVYIGRALTLYGDPTIKWGGMEVGGIRISHMTNIADTMTMALTVTRANKKPFIVQPLVNQAFNYDAALDAMADAVSEAQLKAIFAPAWQRAKKDGNAEMMGTLKANYDTFKAKFAEPEQPAKKEGTVI